MKGGLADTKEAAEAASESAKTAKAALVLSEGTARRQLRAYVMARR